MSIFKRVSRSGGTTTALLLRSWLAMVDPLCSLRPYLPIVSTANKRRDDRRKQLELRSSYHLLSSGKIQCFAIH